MIPEDPVERALRDVRGKLEKAERQLQSVLRAVTVAGVPVLHGGDVSDRVDFLASELVAARAAGQNLIRLRESSAVHVAQLQRQLQEQHDECDRLREQLRAFQPIDPPSDPNANSTTP